MCEADEETNFHMFFQCPSIRQIWYVPANTFVFPLTVFDSSYAAFNWWSRQRIPRRYLILIFLWSSWKWRNSKIFNDSKAPLISILDNLIATWTSVYGLIDNWICLSHTDPLIYESADFPEHCICWFCIPTYMLFLFLCISHRCSHNFACSVNNNANF